MQRTILLLVFVATLILNGSAIAQKVKAPSGKELNAIIKEYMAADEDKRSQMRADADKKYLPLKPGPTLVALRKSILKEVNKAGPKIKGSGTRYFYDKKSKRGKYIIKGRPKKALFIGLHGGGVGSGDAGNMAGAMGGGGWWWIFPEVLEKTEYGWTTSGTEEFVMELIEAAKRTGKVDPNRIYITGHSMGGYGSWTLGAHHADVFAGVAPYAGAPSPIWDGTKVEAIGPGVIPNYFNLRLHFFQSLDDRNVPPAANEQAFKELTEWKKEHPKGFDFKYLRVDGRGHAPPKAGYMPTQKWVASKVRNPRPKKFIWQPILKWKKHFYWIYWNKPQLKAIIEARTNGSNQIDIDAIESAKDLKGLTVLLGDKVADLSKEITINVDGVQKFKGKVEHTFSTLLMTMPRNDPDLLFDARVDLP